MNVTVYLTTTGHLIDIDKRDLLPSLIEEDVPVCVTTSHFNFIGGNEAVIDNLKHIVLQMSKIVHVDVNDQSIHVYEKAPMEENSLVSYSERKKSVFAQSFFKRWPVTEILLFEFQVFCFSKPLFCLKGIWNKGRWTDLKLVNEPRVHIAWYPMN